MRLFIRLFSVVTALFLIFTVAGCSPVDNDYGVVSDVASSQPEAVTELEEKTIMSSDRVMSNYFDISLFDEENYAEIYLGKKFKINAEFLDKELKVPSTLAEINELGWHLAEGNTYDENSLVFAYETIDVVLENENGVKINAQLYNSSRYSIKLSKCYIVKFSLQNNFYESPESYHNFNINGITNTMAITDVINTLGTPSHFYKVSDTCYYLDYFITKKDRRNGITVYINPVDDLIVSVEFSYYK